MRGEGLKKLRSRNIFIILLAFILALSIFTVSNAEEKYEVDGVTAELSEDGTLTITGSGELKKELVRMFDYQNAIKNVVIEEGITRIGYTAFYRCSSLISIEIPSSVTIIGSQAFDGCSSLTSIEIPDGVTSIESSAFYGCSSLTRIQVDENNKNYCSEDGVLFNKERTSIIKYPAGKEDSEYIIPSSVTSIGSYAFEYCSSLISIEIPEGVTSIGNYAFSRCSSLTSIEIPEGVTSIGQDAFSRCSSLISIKIPSSVTIIGSQAFDGCSSLTSIEIPDGVTSIGDHAFRDCSSLISIKIPSSVTIIGSQAFDGCSSLTSIEIPDGVTSIGDSTFKGCSSLTRIQVDENNKNYCSEDGVLFNKERTSIIKYPPGKEDSEYIIPSSVTSIGSYAFEYCRSLTSIEIPSSVISIGSYAFEYCRSLTSIEIPGGVTIIGDYAFCGCISLTRIEIPSSVTSIGSRAFSGCKLRTYIEDVSIKKIEIPEIIKRTITEGDILYTETEGKLTNCSYNDDKTKLILDIDELKGCAIIKIQAGVLEGLTYYISLKEIDISSKEDKSVMARILEDGTIIISGNGSIKNSPDFTAIIDKVVIKQVIIEDGVTRIGDYAFSGCSSLTRIEIPEGVTSIGDSAFWNCSSLESVEIPSSVTFIGQNAFNRCSSLTSINIPEGVKGIERNVFSGCSSLIRIQVDENNKNLCSEDGVLFNKEMTSIIKYPAGKEDSEYIIPSSVTRIWYYAFSECSSLKSIEIPEGVTSIGDDAFWNCSSLTRIKIQEGVTSIGDSAFNRCSSLESITIPNSVIEIGTNAFMYCNKLTIYCKSNSTAEQYAKDNSIEYIIIKTLEEIIEIKEYTLENNIIKGVQPNISLKDTENNIIIHEKEYVKILSKYNKELQETDIITTGCKIQITAYDEIIEYVICVTGDTTGDGQADIKDILSINKHRLNKVKLENEYFQAGDVNNDGIVDIKDILQINKYRLGKINSL